MLKNYLKVAIRNLLKQKFYAFINVLGLAIGIATALLITLYILDELRYDQFHEKADRIYRLATHVRIGESEFNAPFTSAAVAGPLVEEVPEVETAVRMIRWDTQIVRRETQAITEKNVIAADADFFKVFSFPLKEGDPETALSAPNTVVLTEAKAHLYFPEGEAVGNTLYIDNQLFKVTGIMEEVPVLSHFHFNIVYSFTTLPRSKETNWGNINTYTYFLLREGSDIGGVNSKFEALLDKYFEEYRDMQQMGSVFEMFVQPLTSLHLRSHLMEEWEPNGSLHQLYIFGAIALFIILIASINFMNLATARSADRAKEVGVRKTLGSLRSTLIKQFLAESLLMSVLAMGVALGLAELCRIPFNQVSGKNITLDFTANFWLFPGIVFFTVVLGLLAGSYPAFYLTRFRPVEVLRGRLAAGSKGNTFRNSLVVFQFVISITLILCTLLVYQQLGYIRNKDLGFDKENILIIPQSDKLGAQQEAFRQALLEAAAVTSVAFSTNAPFGSYDGMYFNVKGKDKQGQIFNYLPVSYDYLETMDVQLQEGRNFSREFAGDTASVLINEETVRQLGLEQPIGSVLEYHDQQATVVGVIKDYHFESLHSKIHPLVLFLTEQGEHTEVKVQSDNLPETLAFVEAQWKNHAPDTPFAYSFLDEDFDVLFKTEQRLGQLFIIFTGLAIFVACLGLLALAAFVAEQRTKEIGIRKVMGATVGNIITLLSKDFTRLVLIAFCIAVPIGYFAMTRWLQGFAYRVDISLWTFLAVGMIALLIAGLTVSYQSLKAALANPVDSLRNE